MLVKTMHAKRLDMAYQLIMGMHTCRDTHTQQLWSLLHLCQYDLFLTKNIVAGNNWGPPSLAWEACIHSSMSTWSSDEENHWCVDVTRSWAWSWQVNPLFLMSLFTFGDTIDPYDVNWFYYFMWLLVIPSAFSLVIYPLPYFFFHLYYLDILFSFMSLITVA